MAIQVSFRAVGVYCYFENLQLSDVNPHSTVQEVMDSIKHTTTGFDYAFGTTNSGKQIVDSISYEFTDSSQTPYNASGRPENGLRDLDNQIAKLGLVWQYYRSATGTINGTVCEIRFLQRGQPSFTTTALDFYDPFFGALPAEFDLHTYNLTWRLVQIELKPEKQATFAAVKAAAKAK